jgi:hypothetical protein
VKYSPIAPIKLLQDLHYAHELLGDYHLVLAHDVLAHKNDYHQLFFDLRHKYKDLFVILDNSTIELGQPLDVEALLRASELVRANCIVMPDVLGDPVGTVKAGWEFYDEFPVDTNMTFMAVPQGNTITEYELCARLLMEIPGIYYWGIPRRMSNQFGTRNHPTLQELLNYGDAFTRRRKKVPGLEPRVHMLGMSNHCVDDLRCANLPGVMGIDSANPCVLGQSQQFMQGVTAVPHLRRGDYWAHTKATSHTIENIKFVRSSLNGL